jgi:uncharacterized protein YbaP (TraB family)
MEPFRDLGYQLEVWNLLDITCPGLTSYYLLGAISMQDRVSHATTDLVNLLPSVQRHIFEKG